MNSRPLLALAASLLLTLGAAGEQPTAAPPAAAEPGTELPVRRIPHPGEAAEAYFAPDGKLLVANAKLAGDATHQVYTIDLEGRATRINDRGADACSFFFPDGQHLVWTSTRDHLDLPAGGFSDPQNYPQGAELYVSALDGSEIRRLTNNQVYEAEVSISPDGHWILFTRQIDGRLDLWRMRPDGSDEHQITATEEWQEGGAFYLPDSRTILYRAWRRESEGQRGMPMVIFTVKDDGSERKQQTPDDGSVYWAPYPAPDGDHYAYVKMLPPHNFEIYLRSLASGEERRLTTSDAFDGFPAISPDGKLLAFSSSRDAAAGERKLFLYVMDISSLAVDGLRRSPSITPP